MKVCSTIKVILSVLFIMHLSGCMTKVPKRQEMQQGVPSLNSSDSRVYFFNYMFKEDRSLNGYGEIFINSKNVGYINACEYIVVDLSPGEYEFYWVPSMFSETDMKYHTINKIRLTLKKEQIKYLRANTKDTSSKASKLFGAVGALVGMSWEDYLEDKPIAGREYVKKWRAVDYVNESNRIKNINELDQNSTIEEKKYTGTSQNNQQTSILIENDVTISAEKSLEGLKRIYEKNLITKDEYDKERQEILDEL